MRITEINDSDSFSALKDTWNDALQRCDASIFSSWEWLSTWWKHFGEDRNLKILIAKENNEITGIAPLMLSKQQFLRVGTLRKIEFIGKNTSDYNNFILTNDQKQCTTLFLDHLNQTSDWDLLDLTDINENSTLATVFQDLSKNYQPKIQLDISYLCPFILLPNSTKIFIESLNQKTARDLRKGMRRLDEEYNVEFKTQRDFDSIKHAMETFFKLHQKRWQSKGEQGMLASKEIQDFHIDVAENLDSKGYLSLNFLTANDKPVAVIYSFDYNLRKYGYLTGFDPDFGQYSVAKLLKLHLVEDCISRGFKEYDLARGFESHKVNWATGAKETFRQKWLIGVQEANYAHGLIN